MSLYSEWTNMVVDYVKKHGEDAFWDYYGKTEKAIYIKILSNHAIIKKGALESLSNEFDTTPIFMIGFLDGINDSLINPYDVEKVEENTPIELNIDFEKLYFNMLDSKADYLYNLPQWNAIFSEEKRKEIQNSWRKSKVYINKNKKIGRNEPCPCGSGKKYKNCCGKNA